MCSDKRQNKLWCSSCKSFPHADKACGKKLKETVLRYMNADDSESESFVFKVDDNKSHINSLLMDCGATTHMTNDDSIFTSFDK